MAKFCYSEQCVLKAENIPVYVINRQDRLDRWMSMKSQLDRAGIQNYERFAAICPAHFKSIDPSAYAGFYNPLGATWNFEKYMLGSFGCKLSHMAILQMAQAFRLPAVWVMEDDILFDVNISENASEMLSQIEDADPEWSIFYLGGHHRKESDLLRISRTLVRDNGIVETPSLIIPARSYSPLLSLAANHTMEIDVIYGHVIGELGHNYVAVPSLVNQANFSSDIKIC